MSNNDTMIIVCVSILVCFFMFISGYIVSYLSYRLFAETSKRALNRLDVIVQRQGALLEHFRSGVTVKHTVDEVEGGTGGTANIKNLNTWVNEGRPVNDTDRNQPE